MPYTRGCNLEHTLPVVTNLTLMESYLATGVAAAAIAAIVMYATSKAPSYKAGKAGARLPPGPKQHPLIGNLLNFPKEHWDETFAQWQKEHGEHTCRYEREWIIDQNKRRRPRVCEPEHRRGDNAHRKFTGNHRRTIGTKIEDIFRSSLYNHDQRTVSIETCADPIG